MQTLTKDFQKNPWKTRGRFKRKVTDRSLQRPVEYEFDANDNWVEKEIRVQCVCYHFTKANVKQLHIIVLNNRDWKYD